MFERGHITLYGYANKQRQTKEMLRKIALTALLAFGLIACSTPEPTIGPDGKPLPQVYRIAAKDEAKVQFRMLDSVNTLRAARGAPALSLSPELNAAAETHARDMSLQNRPWHFGSDGSSPLDRARRAGYTGKLLGENISETYESELETLSAWMERTESREVILDRRAGEMGFAWYQEPNGKIWWTMVVGQQNARTSLVN